MAWATSTCPTTETAAATPATVGRAQTMLAKVYIYITLLVFRVWPPHLPPYHHITARKGPNNGTVVWALIVCFVLFFLFITLLRSVFSQTTTETAAATVPPPATATAAVPAAAGAAMGTTTLTNIFTETMCLHYHHSTT